MTDCPPRLRGDLSKWLCEIHTGVYVGQVSSRVRDAIWERVCENLKTGRATMVYTTNGEQRMDFRVHNTAWQPVDFDGIKLMRRPLPQTPAQDGALRPGFSHAAQRQMAQRRAHAGPRSPGGYIVIDLETTGLQPASDAILEYGAVKVAGGEPAETFACLVRQAGPIPPAITKLTGITDAMLAEQGREPERALDAFLAFLGGEKLVGYNIAFDMGFLSAACKQYGRPLPANRCVDVMGMARRKVYGVRNYKLATLAERFSLAGGTTHRALDDCELVRRLYAKLNE